MNTGITPDNEFRKDFDLLRIKRTYKCYIVKLDADLKFEVVYRADKTFNFKELPDQLPLDECRYIFVDFDYLTLDNPPRKGNKLIMFTWCPQAAPAKEKTPYSAAASSVYNTLGCNKNIQVNDFAGLDYDEVVSSL